MKNFRTTTRFDNAVRKLYTAFHEGTLDAMDCKHCAVGNLLGHGNWEGIWTENTPIFLRGNNFSNYSIKELGNIERAFIKGSIDGDCKGYFSNTISNRQVEHGFGDKQEQKELQFKGLCAVIEYLAELDGISNPTDYSKLFETKEGKPKYELA